MRSATHSAQAGYEPIELHETNEPRAEDSSANGDGGRPKDEDDCEQDKPNENHNETPVEGSVHEYSEHGDSVGAAQFAVPGDSTANPDDDVPLTGPLVYDGRNAGDGDYRPPDNYRPLFDRYEEEDDARSRKSYNKVYWIILCLSGSLSPFGILYGRIMRIKLFLD